MKNRHIMSILTMSWLAICTGTGIFWVTTPDAPTTDYWNKSVKIFIQHFNKSTNSFHWFLFCLQICQSVMHGLRFPFRFPKDFLSIVYSLNCCLLGAFCTGCGMYCIVEGIMTDSEGSGPESRALDCVSLFSHNFNKKKRKTNQIHNTSI